LLYAYLSAEERPGGANSCGEANHRDSSLKNRTGKITFEINFMFSQNRLQQHLFFINLGLKQIDYLREVSESLCCHPSSEGVTYETYRGTFRIKADLPELSISVEMVAPQSETSSCIS
jgi:hypothetical protein